MVKFRKGKPQKAKAYAVFEGGGVKGIGIAGALKVADKYYTWENVAGTSAGAIIGALVAAGFTAPEIKKELLSFDFRSLQDAGYIGKVPLAGPLLSVLFQLGIYKGEFVEDWLNQKLAEKKVYKFGDLINKGYRNEKLKYRLQVVTSDISRGRMVVLPRDLMYYGIDPDEFSVARAVRMSISIPFFFKPVTLEYVDNNGFFQTSYFIDGGVLSNFPLWLFEEDNGIPRLPTFGFKLVGPDEGRSHEINGPVSFLTAMFSTMLEAHDARHMQDKSLARTITIPTLGIRTTDFNINNKKVMALYNSGKKAAEEFFANWNFKTYIQNFHT